jgi:hypothetical protein
MSQSEVELKPATMPPSNRAKLVSEVGKYRGGASSEGWCGCFITYIKQNDRALEAIVDAALDSGEYTAVYLYKVEQTYVHYFLVAERKENGVSTFYELSGFDDVFMRDAYRLAVQYPKRSHKPVLSAEGAATIAFVLFMFSCFLLTPLVGNPLALLIPLIMVPVYFIAKFYSLDAHARKLKSLALDALPPVIA